MAAEKFEDWRYLPRLPDNRAELAPAWNLLKSYSGIPLEDIGEHVRVVREKAWIVFPYPCIGRWRFLSLYLSGSLLYTEILERVKDGQVFLDAGCCLGQVLRQLAADGAPAHNLVGVDLKQEFIDLGYELFRDRDTFGARFVIANILDPADSTLSDLDGTVNMIHAASLFHLFSWDDQLKLGERMARLFNKKARNAMIFGRQVGSHEANGEIENKGHARERFIHNLGTFQLLWDAIGACTDTKWNVTGRMIDMMPDSAVKRVGIHFIIHKVGDS